MDCESTQTVLRTYINEGMSYGSCLPDQSLNTEMLNTPNALLGLEYIRAGLTYYPSLKYIQSYAHQIITTRILQKIFLLVQHCVNL